MASQLTGGRVSSETDLDMMSRILARLGKPKIKTEPRHVRERYDTQLKYDQELIKEQDVENTPAQLLERQISILTDTKQYSKALILLSKLKQIRERSGKNGQINVKKAIDMLKSNITSLSFQLRAESDATEKWDEKETFLLRLAKLYKLSPSVEKLQAQLKQGRYVPPSAIESLQQQVEEISSSSPGKNGKRRSAEPPLSPGLGTHRECIESMHEILHNLEKQNFVGVLRCFQESWKNTYALPKMFRESKRGKPSVQDAVKKLIARLWRREEERIKTYGETHNTSLFSWLYTGHKAISPSNTKKKSLTAEIMKMMQALYDLESRTSIKDGSYVLLRGTIQLFSVGLVLEEMRTWRGV